MKTVQLTLFLLLVAGQAAYAQRTLTVGYEYMPGFSYVSDNGRYLGVDFEILIATADKAGLKLEFHEIPWKRVLVSIEKGKIDMTAAASQTSERMVYAYFSRPYREEYFSLFVLSKDNKHIGITGFEKLFAGKFRLGTVLGVWYGADFSKYMQQPEFNRHIYEVSTDRQNILMLSGGRIDGFLCEPVLARMEIEKQGLSHRITESRFRYSNGSVHFMFSKISVPQKLVDDYNRALQSIIENGTYERILSDYYQEAVLTSSD